MSHPGYRAAPTCVFCEIVAGAAPATVVRDNPTTLIIVPLCPVTAGHVLVIPKLHVDHSGTAPRVTADVMRDAAVYAALLGQDFNIITSAGAAATQSVPHLHLHVVPRTPGDQLMVPWGTLHGEDPKAPHRCRQVAALEHELAEAWGGR